VELSPAAWHWAKPRGSPPAKFVPPEASPRGREGGPAVTGSRGGAKAPAPEGIKGSVNGDRRPVGRVRVEAAGRVSKAVSGVDLETMPAAADGELVELSQAWKETL